MKVKYLNLAYKMQKFSIFVITISFTKASQYGLVSVGRYIPVWRTEVINSENNIQMD